MHIVWETRLVVSGPAATDITMLLERVLGLVFVDFAACIRIRAYPLLNWEVNRERRIDGD